MLEMKFSLQPQSGGLGTNLTFLNWLMYSHGRDQCLTWTQTAFVLSPRGIVVVCTLNAFLTKEGERAARARAGHVGSLQTLRGCGVSKRKYACAFLFRNARFSRLP
jgi:hypothetical protein